MLAAAISGDIFASPSAAQICSGLDLANTDKGVVFIVSGGTGRERISWVVTINSSSSLLFPSPSRHLLNLLTIHLPAPPSLPLFHIYFPFYDLYMHRSTTTPVISSTLVSQPKRLELLSPSPETRSAEASSLSLSPMTSQSDEPRVVSSADVDWA